MAHELEIINGNASFAFVGDRKAIWHSLGTSVSEAMSIEDAMIQGKVFDTAELHQLINPFTGKPVDDWGVFRMDTQECIGSGLSGNYQIIQNKEVLEACRIMSGLVGDKLFDTIGVLGKGERLFCCIKLPDVVKIDGTKDVQYPYLMASWSHDGSSKVTFKLVFTRPVCANTVAMGLSEHGLEVAISHRKNAKDKMDAALKTIRNAHDVTERMNIVLNELSRKPVTREGFTQIVNKLFGDPGKLEGAAQTRTVNKQYEIAKLFESNDSNTIPEIKGSYYNLLNSIVEYSDHHSPVRKTSGKSDLDVQAIRADNALFGTASALKDSALEIIMETSGVSWESHLTKRLNTMAIERQANAPAPVSTSILDDMLNNA